MGKSWENLKIHSKSKQNKTAESLKFCGFLVRHEGLEPPTFAFVVRDSIQLS